jgi:hypothetical protein
MHMRSAFVFVALLALACGSDSSGPIQSCDTDVTVSTGGGLTPNITWSPRCLAAEVIVDPGTDFAVEWAIVTTDSSNSIQPSVQYGVAPSGTTTIAGPATLAPGHGYRVQVLRATGNSAAPFVLIGTSAFAP